MKNLKNLKKSIQLIKPVEMTKVLGGATDDLWEWRKNIEDGMIDRR